MSCNLCASNNHSELIGFGSHPIAHNYLRDLADDEPEYPFLFHYCEDCGHMFLHNPIVPDLLYENYITLSDWKYQPHIPRLIELIQKYTSAEKTSKILEVGSNDGIFLDALRKDGYESLVGMEPAKDAQDSAISKGLHTIPGYFNCESAEAFVQNFGKCDLLIVRQVLEHIEDLKGFGQAINTALAPGGSVVIEVPDFLCNLENLDYTLWEEHPNYFTLETLSNYLSLIGIRLRHHETTLFSGRTLIVIGEYVGSDSTDLIRPSNDRQQLVRSYQERWPEFTATFANMLKTHRDAGDKIAIYGAGARLCSLINFTDVGSYIECIVDDQKEKQSLYMPGAKLPIVPSDNLGKRDIKICLLAVNTESEDTVINKHSDYVNKGGVFYSVLPPSDRLPPFWVDMIKSDRR
jgi:2-polyprenyl-3-methyl-5-hydroxy-6-metoxy-1,4-benzoquinol methylase